MATLAFILEQKREVLRLWRNNELSLAEAVRRLIELGYSVEDAHRILIKT